MAYLLDHHEKVTVTIPSELKEKLTHLKAELKLSMSMIYKEALESYLEKKEQERWEKAVLQASQDTEYLAFVNDVSGDGGDLYGY